MISNSLINNQVKHKKIRSNNNNKNNCFKFFFLCSLLFLKSGGLKRNINTKAKINSNSL